MQHDVVHDTKPESSRAATNRLLVDLRTRRWRAAAWAQFLAAATARSVEQALCIGPRSPSPPPSTAFPGGGLTCAAAMGRN